MTRRAVIAGVLAVCVTALLVGGIAYLRSSADLDGAVDGRLATWASHPSRLRSSPAMLVQVRGHEGRVLYRSAALAGVGTLPPERVGYATVTLGGRSLRVYTRRLGRRRKLSVATDSASGGALPRLRRGILTGIVVGGLLVAVGLALVLRRALAPLRQAALVADRITRTGDLQSRVPEAEGTDEVAQLTRSINRMLARLETSDDALRRLVADASHELRSPITTLRGNLEQLTDGTELSGADRQEALADALLETKRLQDLVEDLLALARADSPPRAERFPVSALLNGGEWERVEFSPAATEASVRGDLVALRAAIRNLVENADRYAGGCELRVDADERDVTVRVIDHGAGIPEGERAQIFGRFSRGRAAQGHAGSGLGLAIVSATASAHEGAVDVEDTAGGGATFVFRVPRDV